MCTALQYKFKLYNAATKMCRKTVLGPVFGSPPQRYRMRLVSPQLLLLVPVHELLLLLLLLVLCIAPADVTDGSNSSCAFCAHRMSLLNLEQKARAAAALDGVAKEPVFYMAYVSADKVGLQQLPFDGNPNRCAHFVY